MNNIQSLEVMKKVPRKKFSQIISGKHILTFDEETNSSKVENKFRLSKRKSSGNIMSNEYIKNVIKQNFFSDKSNDINENGDIENNDIVLTTNNNQTNKDISNNDNIHYQKQNIHIVSNIPITSSQRVINEEIKNIKSIIDIKNDYITTKRKFIFICLIFYL